MLSDMIVNAAGRQRTLARDDFNRADSTTSLGVASSGQTWQTSGSLWGISTARAYPVTNSVATTAWIDLPGGSPNDYAVAARARQAGNFLGLVGRRDASNLHYMGLFAGSAVVLYVNSTGVTGTYTELARATGAYVPTNSTCVLHISGSTIKAISNGVTRLTITDTTIASGVGVGLFASDLQTRSWDGFRVYSL